VRRDRAYVSLEDAPDGRIALVVRAYLSALRPRCNSSFAIPVAHVTQAPPGVTLRGAPVLSLRWRERLDAGAVSVQVRLRFIPEPLARKIVLRAD
jgi:hypothetical protein